VLGGSRMNNVNRNENEQLLDDSESLQTGNNKMKKFIRPLVLVLLIGMFGYFAYGMVHQSKKTDVGDQAYNFSLPNLDGSTTKLSDYKGKTIVINYFATWCEPCKEEAPELAQYAKDYGDKYPLIMIDRGETKDDVKGFLKKNKSTATFLFDYNATVGKIYNVTGQPETFIIDREGVIREHYNGPLSEGQILNYVKKYDK
jgi:cytochrome c biogenesis protein CcmG/thiol:disulfide interchange protein DsbE